MAITTNIQWCHASWSPWLGCSKVSVGCKNCYITSTTPFRTKNIKHGDPRQRTSVSYWHQAEKWNRKAPKEWNLKPGERGRIFPSLCDWLDEDVPIEWLSSFLCLIFETPNLDWLLLTKRPENFRPRMKAVMEHAFNESQTPDWYYFIADWVAGCAPANVWFGVSVENQEWSDKRIPILNKIPAVVKFLSAEPLLGPIDLSHFSNDVTWVICGGESGDGARECNIKWIEEIVIQCEVAGAACFVKQLGSNSKWNHNIVTGCTEREVVESMQLKHSKGGDIEEFPISLKVRQFPPQVPK